MNEKVEESKSLRLKVVEWQEKNPIKTFFICALIGVAWFFSRGDSNEQKVKQAFLDTMIGNTTLGNFYKDKRITAKAEKLGDSYYAEAKIFHSDSEYDYSYYSGFIDSVELKNKKFTLKPRDQKACIDIATLSGEKCYYPKYSFPLTSFTADDILKEIKAEISAPEDLPIELSQEEGGARTFFSWGISPYYDNVLRKSQPGVYCVIEKIDGTLVMCEGGGLSEETYPKFISFVNAFSKAVYNGYPIEQSAVSKLDEFWKFSGDENNHLTSTVSPKYQSLAWEIEVNFSNSDEYTQMDNSENRKRTVRVVFKN